MVLIHLIQTEQGLGKHYEGMAPLTRTEEVAFEPNVRRRERNIFLECAQTREWADVPELGGRGRAPCSSMHATSPQCLAQSMSAGGSLTSVFLGRNPGAAKA